MNTRGHSDEKRTIVRIGVPADAGATLFVDLDGTLIWTWTPLITSAFMSQVFGLPISTPPTREEGYLKLTKVPFENGRYSLTCRRPNIGLFLRSLRALGDVCLLTHAPRDYALRMNGAFAFGFTDDRIFTLPADYQTLSDRFRTPQKLTVLIDDEGPGWKRCWRGRANYEGYDHHADSRHQEKCFCIGVRPRSRRDIAYPRFYGRKDDLFRVTALRPALVQRLAKVLRQYRQKGSR